VAGRLIFTFSPAIELSWNVDFIGDTVNALEEHIRRELEKGMLYARYCSIVQSSGMGKSRLLDEFSKRHFLIPINLRDKGSQGNVVSLSPSCPDKHDS
jgi:hypothetical protein